MVNEQIKQVETNILDIIQKMVLTKDINNSTEREAMGLSAALLDIYSGLFETINHSYRSNDVNELLAIVENRSSHILERICSANLLAVIGDPRISEVPQMVKIDSGTAVIGTHNEDIARIHKTFARFGVKESWIKKESPQYQTQLESFAIAKYPITNSQYRAFLLDTEHDELPSSWLYGAYPMEKSNHPVFTLSDRSALAYCQWLSEKTGRIFHLPTEEQWEYACNEGRANQYIWGDTFEYWKANTNELLLLTTTPVGVFHEGATGAGVYDLLGNVEEYVETYYEPHPGGEIIEDDLYLKLGKYRIAKGGAFNRFSDLARIQRRHGAYPSSLYAMGFRIAEKLKI